MSSPLPSQAEEPFDSREIGTHAHADDHDAGVGAHGTTPGRLPAARRRRQLLDVALETFGRKGYEATTMEDIAESAGVTKPLLYQHFDSKRALYLELLADIEAKLVGQVAAATSAAARGRQKVEQGMAAYFAFVLAHESAFRVLFGRSAPHDPELGVALRRVEHTIAEAVVPLIDADIHEEHRRLLAYSVVGMAEGAVRHWLELFPGRPHTREEADLAAHRVSDLAWAGLRGIRRD